jgi:hypothetical protein
MKAPERPQTHGRNSLHVRKISVTEVFKDTIIYADVKSYSRHNTLPRIFISTKAMLLKLIFSSRADGCVAFVGVSE